jgi:SNF2 family DNA or RNA helicase
VDLILTSDYVRGRAARHVPGAYFEDGAWHIDTESLNDLGRRMIVKLFPEHSEAVGPLSQEDVRPMAASDDLYRGVPHEGLTSDGRLYAYQARDVAYCARRIQQDGGAYLGWDRGLGKTLGALALAHELGDKAIMIVTPNSSKSTVWQPEVKKWYPDWRVFDYGGTKAKRHAQYSGWCNALNHGDVAVLMVHYEALRLLPDPIDEVDLIVVDEAHRLAKGAPRGGNVPQFYKRLIKVPSKHRVCLSGSVLVNGVEDIFGAAHFLFPGTYRSKWKDWNNRFVHYVDTGYGNEPIGIIPGKEPELQAELGAWMCVRHKTDELPGLPERIVQHLYVDLPPHQRRVYDELAEQFFTNVTDEEVIVAPNVITQLTKLRQIATGLDLVSETVEESAKIDLCLDLVRDNLPRKTVVFCWHKATVAAVAARLDALGVGYVTVTGDTPQITRGKYVDEFQTQDWCKVIVATIKTLGESVTLHAAADLIFVESSWTAADMDQAADRVYRIGQERRVTVTHLIARNTIDDLRVLPAVMSKDALRRAVMGGNS